MKQIKVFISTETDHETAASGYGIILQYDQHEKKIAGYVPTKSFFDVFHCAISDSLALISEPCQVDIYIENSYPTTEVYLSETAQKAKHLYENNCKLHQVKLHENDNNKKFTECKMLAEEGMNEGQRVVETLLFDTEVNNEEQEMKKAFWW